MVKTENLLGLVYTCTLNWYTVLKTWIFSLARCGGGGGGKGWPTMMILGADTPSHL